MGAGPTLPSRVPSRLGGILMMTEPPYRGFRRIELPRTRVAEGSVIVFRPTVNRIFGAEGPLFPWLHHVRRRLPSALLVAQLDGVPEHRRLALARKLARVGIRVAIARKPAIHTLRSVLRDLGLLDVDVATWLRIRLAAAEPDELALCEGLGHLVARGMERPRDDPVRLKPLLRALGLPTIHKWRMLAKILGPVIALQTDPTLSVAAAAIESSYAGQRSLDYACKSLTGLTAKGLGDYLGWEVVLARMLGLEGNPHDEETFLPVPWGG